MLYPLITLLSYFKRNETRKEMAWNNYSSNKKTSKYNSTKKEYKGIVFDSKKEYKRYLELEILLRAEKISNLELQKTYILIPSMGEFADGIIKEYEKGKSKCLERACTYKADFVYTDNETGKTVVEDTKGFKTKDYIIKRKLMLYVHKIRISEI